MALTETYLPKYKGLSGTHPQLEDSAILDDDTDITLGLPVTTAGTKLACATKTTTYIITTADDLIIGNATTAFTVSLPAASGAGQRVIIKNINTGTVSVAPDGTDTIDGVNSAVILERYESVTLVDYASGAWAIVY